MALLLRVMLCAALAWGHRVQRLEHLKPDASEEALLKEAKLAFKPPRFYIPSFKIISNLILRVVNLQRDSNETIFEQSRYALEYKDPGAWGFNWTKVGFGGFAINFTDELGVDNMGLRKEWLSLVVESVVMPESHTKKNLQCITSGKCADADAHQYLLKALPTGELIPISVEEEMESSESESAGMFGSVLKSAYNAYESAYESVMGTMPYATGVRFKFLGKWLARAYLVSGLGYAPMGFHELIYQSLVAGHVVEPEPVTSFYKEDTIAACEKVVGIYRSRRPQELQSYGWVKCSEVKDPETNTYLEESCYKPIYKDPMMWDALWLSWGPFAPSGAKAEDPVPFEKAKDYTERRCQATWKSFADPVSFVVKGFREVIPGDSAFWKLLKDSAQLKHLLEGNSDVDVDALLEKVEWTGGWDDENQAVVTEVFHELQTAGQGLPPSERLLNQLLRFFTGSLKEPVEGWENTNLEFSIFESEHCQPLVGKTCFNELRIPSACVKDAETFKEIISESVLSTHFGYE